VRDETSLDVKRTDFKLDMVPAHLFMNFRVVDEHGRQLGMGRNLAALKAELGAQARGAFQALAGLKVAPSQGGGSFSLPLWGREGWGRLRGAPAASPPPNLPRRGEEPTRPSATPPGPSASSPN
jgi:ATP-dependent helicase HrpA